MNRSALVIPVDMRGLILLQQKTYDAPNYPGVWSFFGGAVEEGEESLQTARRELKEELELDLPATAFEFFRTFVTEGVSKKERHVYVVRFVDEPKLDLKEGRGLGYFSKTELAHLSMPDHIRNMVESYFEQSK